MAATEDVEPPVDLVVWPEDVIDTDEAFVDDPWADVVGALAEDLGAPMIVDTVEGDGPAAFRNAAVLVGSDGEVLPRDEKLHRVPFGEYVPLRWLLLPIAADAVPHRSAATGAPPAALHGPPAGSRGAFPRRTN